MQLLMPFSSTWLREVCFSALLGIKNKTRNKLIAELDQRCALSTTEPRIDKFPFKKCDTNNFFFLRMEIIRPLVIQGFLFIYIICFVGERQLLQVCAYQQCFSQHLRTPEMLAQN